MKTIHLVVLLFVGAFALQAQPAAAPPVPPPATFAPPAVPVVAVPGPGGEKVIPKGMLRLEAAPLDQALNFFAELVGRTLIRPAVLPNVSINFRAQTDLTHAEAVEALTTLFAANDIAVLPVGEKFVKAVPAANAMKEGSPFSPLEWVHLPEADTFTTKVIKLKNIHPSEITQLLQPLAKLQGGITAIDSSSTLVLRDYAANVKRMLELVEKIDVLIPIDDEVELIPIKYALSADISAVMGSLTWAITVASRTGTAGAAGGSVGNFGSGMGGTGGSAGGGAPASPGGGAGNSPGQQGNPQRSLQQRLQQAVGRSGAIGGSGAPILGEAKIISYERSNSILVIAHRQEMALAKKLLAQLDTVQQHVLIEAIIMDVSLNNESEVGVSIAQQKQALRSSSPSIASALGMKNGGNFFTTNSINALTSGGLNYWGFLGSSWEAAVNAVSTDARVNILSRPRIQTSHAELGQFFVGETHPYITGTTTDITGSNRSTYQDKKIGITLEVLPFINPDGLMVMDINQVVQDIIGEKNIDGNPVPITAERSANAKIAVKDREAVMLGGFIRTKKTKTVSGVPVLKDIPLLGMLFSNNADTMDRKELIVMMRPTVLPTPESAAAAAQMERDNLPGVKRAEMNERKIETEEQKELEKLLRADERKNRNKKP